MKSFPTLRAFVSVYQWVTRYRKWNFKAITMLKKLK